MKHRLILTLLLAVFGIPEQGWAQRQWARQTSGTPVTLNDVFFVNDNTGMAVGLGGTVLRTEDAGVNWVQQTSITSNHLNGVHFVDVNVGTAVGNGGRIIRTTDGGQTWTLQTSNTPFILYGVFFTDSDNGFAVGQNGLILRTANAGLSWTSRNISVVTLRSVFFTDGQSGTAVGSGGSIFQTNDGGDSWTPRTSGTGAPIFDVFFPNANTGIAVGSVGLVLRTEDGGTTWTSQTSITPAALSSVAFVGPLIGTAVGTGGTIIQTVDGENWTLDVSNTSSTLEGVFFSSSNAGTAVGVGGTIVRTTSCTVGISPMNVSFSPNAASASVNVTTGVGCPWTAASNDSWISIDNGSSGVANGTVNYSIQSNTGGAIRNGTLTIGGQTFTVTQSACSLTISPANASFDVTGGIGTVTVTANATCDWTAVSNASWITITSGGGGTGNGTVTYSAGQNNSASSRVGTITIGGQAFTVSQTASTGNLPPVVVNPIADQTLLAERAAFTRDLAAPPPVFEDPEGDALVYFAFSSINAIADATIVGSVLTVTPLAVGSTSITVGAFDALENEASQTFVVTVAQPCWELDSFEGLRAGPLGGQSSWFPVPGRSSAVVIANPYGAGSVLRLDASPGQTIIMDKDVVNQATGTHSIKMNVLVDGSLTPGGDPTLAKIEIRTTGNSRWDKKFQLYFGAHMRINYDNNEGSAFIFLTENELELQRWYEVEAVIDLATNLVDVYLDGVLRLSDVAVGPGPITDIGLSAWDRPGIVLYDDMSFCNEQPVTTDLQPCTALSTFNFSAEGWTVVGDAQNSTVIPDHVTTGGNPGGHVSATDDVTGGTWYWRAPRTFLGNVSCAYGQPLEFDLMQTPTSNQFNSEDVVLEGGGLRLVLDTPCNPGLCGGLDWTHYSVPLSETAGWIKDDTKNGTIAGDPATQQDLQTVLANITSLLIRGEFVSGPDVGRLDNVGFRVTTDMVDVERAPMSRTIVGGDDATYSVTVNPIDGAVDEEFSFACSDVPALASCTFSPSTVVVGRRSETSMLTISTTAGVQTAVESPIWNGRLPDYRWLIFGLASVALMNAMFIRISQMKRRRARWALSAYAFVVVLAMGCREALTAPENGTPPGTYVVTITATASSVQQTTSVTVVIE